VPRGFWRNKTVGRKELRRAVAGEQLEPDEAEVRAELEAVRPRTRADCEDGPRPCPFVSCRHHLYLDVTFGGGLKLNYPDKEIWELEHTCALDLAERGGMTLQQVGEVLQLTRERVRQIELHAGPKVRAAGVEP
jgi:hypothetical protein